MGQALDHDPREALIACTWPASWWLDDSAALRRYVRAEFRCVPENERTVVSTCDQKLAPL